jgi:cell division protein FtsQ
MARKNSPPIAQEELYLPPDEPAREELDDARMLDLDAEAESPFLRGQKRVSVRRGTLPKKTATRLVWLTIAAIVLFFCSLAVASLYHYGEHSWRFRVESSDDIEISGLSNVSRSQILEVMGGDIGRNIFFVPLAQRKAQLEQIPWVESASVMRFVPNRLKIEIHERTPVAFARIGSKILLVDSKGVLMELPTGTRRKYSFPVIVGMNTGEPLSTRAARMKIYDDLVSQLDSSGAHYSQDISEVDLSDPEDVKVLASDQRGDVLVHLGSSNYLDRYKIYIVHVQEWRQQFEKLDSVDLRYDRQIIVNPDLRGTMTQPPLSAKGMKAAMAAGVKPASLVTKEPHVQPVAVNAAPAVPGKKITQSKKAERPQKLRKKPASASRWHKRARVSPKHAATAGQVSKMPAKSAASAGRSKKPSPAIAKGQDPS